MKLDDNLEKNLWLVGYVDGKGFFNIYLRFNDVYCKEEAMVEFQIKSNDIRLLYALKKKFGYGQVLKKKRRFVIRNYKGIINSVIPFFDKFSLRTNKKLEYYKFREAVHILKNRLTEVELNKLRNLRESIHQIRTEIER